MSTLPVQELVTPEVVPEVAAGDREAERASRRMHWSLWLASLAVLTVALVLEVQDGTSVSVPVLGRTLPELCYWRTMFGMDCPGCGLTRCFVAAAHGQLAAAWRYNPVGLMLFSAVVLQIPYRLWQLRRLATGRDEFRTVALPYVMLGISVLLIVQWLWRLMA